MEKFKRTLFLPKWAPKLSRLEEKFLLNNTHVLLKVLLLSKFFTPPWQIWRPLTAKEEGGYPTPLSPLGCTTDKHSSEAAANHP